MSKCTGVFIIRSESKCLLFFRNPMCAVFPTEVSCSIPNVGAAGGQQVTLEPVDIQENKWRTFLAMNNRLTLHYPLVIGCNLALEKSKHKNCYAKIIEVLKSCF